MTVINTNTASTRGLRNLQKASKSLGTTLTRLQTGLKINSGKDNPSGLIAGETLRLQVTTIEQSIKNSNRANNVIATVDGALGEISGLLNQVRGLVQEGLNSGALSQDEIEANQNQINTALSAINRISSNTTFAGDKLIDGSKAFNTRLTAADAAELSDFQINEALFGSSSEIQINANINAVAERGTLTYSGGDPTSALTLEVAGSKGTEVLFFGDASTTSEIATAINAVTDATGVTATAATSTAGTGTITSTAAGGNDVLTFTERRVTGDTITVNLAEATNNSTTSVSSVTGVGTGAVTITVELGDAAGTSNTVAADIISAIQNDSTANSLVTVANAGPGTDTFAVADAGGGVAVNTGKAIGDLVLSSDGFGSAEFVDLNVLTGTFATLNAAGTATFRDEGTDVSATINGQQAQGRGLEASIRTGSLDASLTFTSAANLATTSTTINVTGGGATFQIGEQVSVTGQIGVGIEAINTARLGGLSGKLYELGSGGGKSLLDVGPNVQGSDLVDIVDQALNRVSSLRGRLGAIQQNVIETNISTLGVALENISEARSQIVDTDFAVETANLTKAQILSQAGISTLSIANQTPQQVLSLLG